MRPDMLAYMRRDRCQCPKRPDAYGRGAAHLAPRRGSEEFPAADVVVEPCPEWAASREQARQCEKKVRQLDDSMRTGDEDRGYSSLMAERDQTIDTLRYWQRKLAKLQHGEPTP